MASSIEPDFNPPDHLSRDEVIAMAKHYINYWKIEATCESNRFYTALVDMNTLRRQVEKMTKDLDALNNGERNS